MRKRVCLTLKVIEERLVWWQKVPKIWWSKRCCSVESAMVKSLGDDWSLLKHLEGFFPSQTKVKFKTYGLYVCKCAGRRGETVCSSLYKFPSLMYAASGFCSICKISCYIQQIKLLLSQARRRGLQTSDIDRMIWLDLVLYPEMTTRTSNHQFLFWRNGSCWTTE